MFNKHSGDVMKVKENIKKTIILSALSIGLAGCFNMPTPTAQITGAYTSGIKYEDYSCDRLGKEVSSLARRENQLTVAQEQRIKSSGMQAFFWGFGQGDGIEASELANVRGEKEALRSAIDLKNCDIDIPATPTPSTEVKKEIPDYPTSKR